MRIDAESGYFEVPPSEGMLEDLHRAESDENFVPVEPRFAATVMLVRPAGAGKTEYRISDGAYPENFPEGQEMEVFMLRRVKTMAFVPDAVVFPGGGVDVRDSNPELPWCGPSPAQWSEIMGCDEETARRVVVAAVREVFEESSVLLAGPDEDSVVEFHDDEVWEKHRAALEHHEESFAEILINHGLVIRTDLLGLVSHFCTPECEPKRYDTYFFSALMPEGQVAAGKTSEAQVADWVTPAYAVREGDAKRWRVLPPTMFNLGCIARSNDARRFVQERHHVRKIMGVPRHGEDGSVVMRFDIGNL